MAINIQKVYYVELIKLMVSVPFFVIKDILSFSVPFYGIKVGKSYIYNRNFNKGGFIHCFFDKLEKCNVK